MVGLPPSGDYLLDVAGTYYWLPDDALDSTTLVAGRPNVVPFNYSLASDATLTLNLTNLAPWTANDQIEVLSLGANDFENTGPFGCNPAPLPAANGTTLNASVFSVKNCGGPNTIQAAQGDTVVIQQMHPQQTSNGSGYLTLASYFQAAPLSLSDGQNVTVSGAMTSVAQTQTLSCDFRLSQFAAALAGLLPSGYTSSPAYGLSVSGVSFVASNGAEPVQATSDILIYSPSPANVDAVSGPMTYGIPAGYPFVPTGLLSYDYFLSFAFPGTTAANQQSVGFQTVFSLATLCQSPVVPVLSPVQAITLNGADASKPLSGVGLTPQVAWTPPAKGTPSRYHVVINQFTKSKNGLYTLQNFVGQIITQQLEVRIPPGLLAAGNTYSINLIADDTVPIGGNYLVPGESSSAALTAVFTP